MERLTFEDMTRPSVEANSSSKFLVNRSLTLLISFVIINILLIIDTSIVRISTFTGGMYPLERLYDSFRNNLCCIRYWERYYYSIGDKPVAFNFSQQIIIIQIFFCWNYGNSVRYSTHDFYSDMSNNY